MRCLAPSGGPAPRPRAGTDERIGFAKTITATLFETLLGSTALVRVAQEP